jgi:hypothetical protein
MRRIDATATRQLTAAESTEISGGLRLPTRFGLEMDTLAEPAWPPAEGPHPWICGTPLLTPWER